MKKIVVAALAALTVSACSPTERIAAYCADLGFEKGTPGYQECNLRLMEARLNSGGGGGSRPRQCQTFGPGQTVCF